MHRQSKPNAQAVLASSSLTGQAANRTSLPQPGQQSNLEPITHEFQINTGYFHCQEHRSFYPYFNYEVVKVQTATVDRNAYTTPDTFHILNFPIDHLNEHLMAEATKLFNLRSITFHNPLSPEVFRDNYIPIQAMTLNILRHVLSLTRITLCVDMLNNELFRTLRSQSYLREVEILPPTTTISISFPDGLVQIGQVLNTGIIRLPQVEYFKIPLELVTGTLLSCLGGLPSLRFLKTTGSANTPYPGRFFIRCMDYLHVHDPKHFGSLQLLDVRDNVLQEDFFSKDTLTKKFPNTKFIKT